MSDFQTGSGLLAGIVALLMIVVYLHVTDTNILIAKMVGAGVDPILARCAVSGDTVSAACVAVAMRK